MTEKAIIEPPGIQRFTFTSFGNGFSGNTFKKFDVSGDTLHVLDISGSENLAIRIGDNLSSFIPIRRGMTIKRKFRSIFVGVVNGQTVFAPHDATLNITRNIYPTVAEFVASYGDLILNPGEDVNYDFHAGFYAMSDCIATTTARLVMEDLIDGTDWDRYEFGRKGCTVFIRNSDLANTVYIFWEFENAAFAGGASKQGWRLYPGESVTMKWSDRLMRRNLNPGGGAVEGLRIGTISGTARYDWMISRPSNAFPLTVSPSNKIVEDK